MGKRRLVPWERNWLIKHGKGEVNIDEYGEMPVEYITGYAGILGREFKVDKRVLISRVEEEGLIKLAMEICPKKKKLVVVDVGTGSGCIGISLYLELKKRGIEPEIYLSDISEKALEVARENVELSLRGASCERRGNLAKRSEIILIKSDLMSDYPEDLKFDLIVANLPYIPSGRMKKLPRSVKDYEPLIALNGGKDGLVLIKKLISQLPERLNQNGVAILEIDETHKLTDFNGLSSLRGASGERRGNLFGEIKKDQFGKNRFLTVFRHPEEPRRRV